MNWKTFFVGGCLGVVLVVAGFLLVTNATNATNTRTANEAPHIWEVATPSDNPSSLSASGERQQRTPERPKVSISLSQIVANVNKATMSKSGMKFIVRYEDGPFAVIEINPALWEALSPLQQRAAGTNFATLFGATGGINCRVKVYGVEVGHVSTSVLGGWQYEAR